MSLTETVQAVKAGHTSASANLERYLKKIAEKKDLNAFITSLEETARIKAKNVDERIKRGEKVGPLAGAVIAIKDNINISGQHCA